MKDITNTIELKEHLGSFQPKDPFGFAASIILSQAQEINPFQRDQDEYVCSVLFNKGRYFETSIDDPKILKEVSELIDSPIKYRNMIVDSWRKLEDFVIAMNCLGIYVSIHTDWI